MKHPLFKRPLFKRSKLHASGRLDMLHFDYKAVPFAPLIDLAMAA